MSMREAVAKGARLLDRKYRGWALKISVPELNLGSSRLCVLGQLYKDRVDESVDLYSGYEVGRRVLRIDTDEYGFDDPTSNSYAALTRMWIREIGARLAGRRRP